MEAGARTGRTSKGHGTRERIVGVAAKLMHQQGVAGTSTPAVRREAGVSSSQIYHYFTNKDDLTRAVVDHQVWTVVGAQAKTLGEVEDLPGLVTWRDSLVEYAGKTEGAGGCPVGSLAAELADADENAREALAQGFATWQIAFRDALARIMRGTGVADRDAENSLAWALLAAVQGGLLLAQSSRGTQALECGVDAVIAQVAAQHASLQVP